MMNRRITFPWIMAGVAVAVWAALGVLTFLVGPLISPDEAPTEVEAPEEGTQGPLPPTEPKTADPAEQVTPIRKRLGFVIELHEVEDVDACLAAIESIAALGADSLELIAPMYQENIGATRIFHDPTKAPEVEELYALVWRAQRRNLRVTLTPTIYLTAPATNESRGVILPDDWDAWWASYEENLQRIVELAVERQVEAISVGSELNTTENMAERWGPLIGRIRQKYNGALTYTANWDRYQKVAFWEDLDFISVSGWWTISDDPAAPVENVITAWAPIQTTLLKFAEDHGRPVVLAEIGYPALPWALQKPWNSEPGEETTPNHEAQSRGFAAFFEAWDETYATDPRFGGFFIYKWDVRAQIANAAAAADPDDEAIAPIDFGFGVREKPAMEVVEEWFERLKAARRKEGV